MLEGVAREIIFNRVLRPRSQAGQGLPGKAVPILIPVTLPERSDTTFFNFGPVEGSPCSRERVCAGDTIRPELKLVATSIEYLGGVGVLI